MRPETKINSVRNKSGAVVAGGGLELIPLVEDGAQLVHLVLEPQDAVGMEGAELVEVLLLPLAVAEGAEVGGVDELQRDAKPRRQLVLDLLEHVLRLVAREQGPGLVPDAVELGRPRAGPGVHQPGVGALVQVVGVVAAEPVARHGHVRRHRDAQQRVPEPHDVHVREEEAVAELQDAALEPDPAPHHVQVVLGHVPLLRREVGAADVQGVAERVRPRAPLPRLGVDGDDEEVLQQGLRLHARAEALQEAVRERAGSCPRLVCDGHYHRLVVLRGSSSQQLGKLVVVGIGRRGSSNLMSCSITTSHKLGRFFFMRCW